MVRSAGWGELIAYFLVFLGGGCALSGPRGSNVWPVSCEDAPKLAVNTLEDLGYRITGRFDPSAKAQGVVTAKKGSGRAKERVSVVLRCETGILGKTGDSVEVLPQAIAWRPAKSEFPDRFRGRFAEYAAGTAKPMERPAQPAVAVELAAALLSEAQVEREFKLHLGPAGLKAAKVEVRNLGDRPFVMSADLARVRKPSGETISAVPLREASNLVARSAAGSGKQIYHDLEEAYLGHRLLKPGAERAGLLFFSGSPEGNLTLPVMDAESGEAKELSAPLRPAAGR